MENQQIPKKKFYKKWWFWVLVVVVVFIIIGASNSSSPSKVGEDGTPATADTQQQTIFKIGDKVKIKNTVLTVTKVNKNWQSSNQFDTPSNPGDVYVIVTISLENQGSDTLDLSGFWDFKLQDGNGVIHDQGIGGIGLNKLNAGSLAAGGKTSGDVIFNVPKDATSNLTLQYQPLLSFSQPVVIELQ